MKKILRHFKYGQKGFTLIELLVVVAILGVLAAVAVPNVAKFINSGKEQAWATELHDIQTGVTAMLADSEAGELDADYPGPVTDMDTVKCDAGAKALSAYMIGLDADNVVKTGCSYSFTKSGTVSQVTP